MCAVAAELAGLRLRDAVDVVAVGVGPVEAASGTAQALNARRYGTLINAGIGGGFRARRRVGDALIVAVEHYVELGLEDGSEFALPAGLQLERRIVADAALLAAVSGIAPVGAGVTSATVTSTAARAEALAARFDPDVESMEGFATLRAAALAGVPALEVRGISNLVGDRASGGWDFRAGAQAAVATTDALLDVLLAE